ncbi:ankyrin repeat domain-containing protein [Pseudoxanthomonas daejeonensis]|uniref:ankyrin repeat domain-containing protein n=1 Tax=Pseudoxanthomonas daejeonensis TaxID=266062 RepID=UPI001F543CEB|nr:ankyrin repeat domain-containing protein [Pseudoxanthomonas daejeonensis]UNK58979.1 ankyrin repeat domain-containing protein [Pseudoxanthomonas daejeonensis]
MAEALPRSRRFALGAGVAGIALGVLAGIEGPVSLLPGLLAQLLLALAVSWWTGTRPVPADLRALKPALSGLSLLWGLGLLFTLVLLAWPLQALRQSGGLGAALGASAMGAMVLLGLWRTWPVWQALEREAVHLGTAWRRLAQQETGTWAGLGAAGAVAAILGGLLLLGWPGLLDSPARWAVAAVLALAQPALHLVLQRAPAPRTLAGPLEFLAAADAPPAESLPEVLTGDPGALAAELHAAARTGRVDRALQLLDAGADAHAAPPAGERDQRSLAALAAVLPDLRLLRALIVRGVDLNSGSAGMTPLLAATRDSWHGRPEAVMTLLANGADPRAADTEGNTPLHHAARSTDPGVAALLRDAAAEIDALNHEGFSPLGVACASGNWRLARFLLERGARPEPVDGQPALLAAAATEEDDTAGVQLLLKFKAKVAMPGRNGRTALHEAALAGHADIVAALLAAGADPQVRDAAGRTPWLEAARALRGGVVEHLAAQRIDVAATDAEGRNALALAAGAEQASLALVRRLLELGVDPAQADHGGRRAIDIAAESGRWSIVAALDPAYPLPAAVAEAAAENPVDERPPLALLRDGLQAGRMEGLAALARLCAPSELGGLLHDPTLRTHAGMVEWLLAHGADPEVAIDGETALTALLGEGGDAAAAIQVLLGHGASPAGAGGLARLLAACVQRDQAQRSHEQLALDLFAQGADPFAPSAGGDPALSLAVRLGWLRLLDALLDAGVDREVRDSHGMTALHLAAALGRESALRRLVAQGASPDARAADGQTPLGVALASGRRDLADWLDWRVWPLPKRPLREADVVSAAMAGDADAVRRLLELGFPVDAVDAQGCTGLLRAAGGGHAAAVDLLLARGADPQHAAHSGATPLSAAVSMRQTAIVTALLDAGADLEHRLPGGVTVLMLASALGLADITARLLTAGANIDAGDSQGLAPLHCAALYGFTGRDRTRLLALFDTLLLAGAEADMPAAGGVTPLLLLLGARAEPGGACDENVVLAGLERLLEEGVSLEVQDPRGFGPLHLAALHGLRGVVQRLLRAGADPDLRDTLNRSPREIAVMRGFVDVAGEFAPAQTGVSMARFLREPRG